MDPSYGGVWPCSLVLLAYSLDSSNGRAAELVLFHRLSRVLADKTWKVLEDAIHEINNHNASGLSFEELYRCASYVVLGL